MGDTKEDISLAYAYPLCKVTDMPDDMRTEAMEATVTAVEKYSDNYETAARMVKDLLDKKFGAPFNVVIGEDYSYCCTHQEKSMLLMFTNGNVAALIWRTVASFG
ncbi:dynein light chain 4, axonemal-like [Trichogramma pretiosum]|uniref:dynein light chain 4, axonemal-like n=1 Tax=Trichogramma pretiosum TaxID=7493 RepID=UPI0006C96B49|nr:dynein light chain 4, axonemal-like [Trichogramma pretiosum]